MGWLEGWCRRRPVTISGATGAGSGYQVRLRIGESAGAAGADFHLDGGSARFPFGCGNSGDLRITLSDGTTLCPLWVESVSGDAPNRTALVWVRVPVDLGSDVTLYVYYRRAGAANVADAAAVFDFFDDFSALDLGSIDGQSGWTVGRNGGTADVVLVGEEKHLRLSSSSYNTDAHHAFAADSQQGYCIRLREYADDWNEGFMQCFADGALNSDGTVSDGYEAIWWGWAGSKSKIRRWVNGGATDLAVIDDADANNVYRILEFGWRGSTLKAFRDGAEMMSATDAQYSTRSHIHLQAWWGSSRYVQWVLVRRWVPVEPSFGSAGSEESTSDPCYDKHSNVVGGVSHACAPSTLAYRAQWPHPSRIVLSTIGFTRGGVGQSPYWTRAGDGVISGTVRVLGTPARRRVALFDRRSYRLVDVVWSDPETGEYRFEGVDPRFDYLVVCDDYTKTYNAEAADWIRPEDDES